MPVAAHFRFVPDARWTEYVGIFFHLAVFLLVFKLPPPEWARAAGYSWLLLDVAAGVLRINQQGWLAAKLVGLGSNWVRGPSEEPSDEKTDAE